MIEADGLTRRYGAVLAADDVRFTVAPGEVVGLIGPNGAGKTTILRMLAGILTPTSGHARICGIDTQVDAFEVKRRLGFLSGETALYQRLTPREILRTFGRLHNMADPDIDRRIEALIAQLRMGGFADRRCGALSAGQKQKANIARAFLHDPPALILDEPTSTLDVVTGRFLLEAIASAREQGKSVLFSTHILGEAEFLCSRVLFLHNGRILDQGPLAEVIERAGARTLTEAFLSRIDQAERLAAGTGELPAS